MEGYTGITKWFVVKNEIAKIGRKLQVHFLPKYCIQIVHKLPQSIRPRLLWVEPTLWLMKSLVERKECAEQLLINKSVLSEITKACESMAWLQEVIWLYPSFMVVEENSCSEFTQDTWWRMEGIWAERLC